MIGEYGGPRLPKSLARSGEFQLEIPKSTVVIDGDCENSPFDDLPRYAACFANHSRECPNARLEKWWELGAIPATEIRERMVLVALEDIAPGTELRFDYEGGNGGQGYWNIMGERRLPALVASRAAAAAAAAAGRRRRAEHGPEARAAYRRRRRRGQHRRRRRRRREGERVAGGGPRRRPSDGLGGRARRRRSLGVVPLLLKSNPSNWPLIRHIPGRSGKECKGGGAASRRRPPSPTAAHST